MLLQVNGELCNFIPIQEFRIRHLLSPDFGINKFLPEDYAGLGHIEEAGLESQMVHAAVLAAIPQSSPPSWRGMTLDLQHVFHTQLYVINHKLNLKKTEIEYAVLGFGEVCQCYVNGFLNAWMCRQPIPSFEDVYSDWLTRTTELSQRGFDYPHQGQNWEIRLVRRAYGIVGLAIGTNEKVFYAYDADRSCAAEGFMFNLLKEVTAKIGELADKSALEMLHDA